MSNNSLTFCQKCQPHLGQSNALHVYKTTANYFNFLQLSILSHEVSPRQYIALKNDIYEFNTQRKNIIVTLHFNNRCRSSKSIGNSTAKATKPVICVQIHMVNERYQHTNIWLDSWHQCNKETRVIPFIPLILGRRIRNILLTPETDSSHYN